MGRRDQGELEGGAAGATQQPDGQVGERGYVSVAGAPWGAVLMLVGMNVQARLRAFVPLCSGLLCVNVSVEV